MKRISKEFDCQAKQEGWAIFDADGILEIQKIDDPEGVSEEIGFPVAHEFKSDRDALDHIIKRASEGSELHLFALYVDGRHDEDEGYIPKAFRKFLA